VPGLDGVGIGYKESSVYMSIGREDFGEYVVGCASRKCGYRGRFAPVEAMNWVGL
jgi:hypothetical protein